VDDRGLLGLLQLADSGFPNGAYALSHGLETLIADGIVRNEDDLGEVLQVTLISRLARSDLPALLGAHRAAAQPDQAIARVRAIDQVLSAVKLAREEREGSVRVGRRVAAEAGALVQSPALDAFKTAIEAHHTPGNSAAAFGLAAQAFKVDGHAAALAAGSSFSQAFAMAAVRLGLIGHRSAQLTIRAAGTWIEQAVAVAETIDPLDLRPSGAQLDLALARHEVAPIRAFGS
jgi:urease accessory protein